MAIENEQEKKTSLLLEDLSSLEGYINDLFVFAPLPICFISPRGVILEANPAFAKLSDSSVSDIIGASLSDFFKKGEAEKLQEDTLKKGLIEGREMVFSSRGMKEIIVQAFTRVRGDEEGVPVGFFLSLFDLTEIKRTEGNVKETQIALLNILEDTEEARRIAEDEKNKTKAIIDNFTDGLFVFDTEGKLSSINPQAEIFFDVKSRDIEGKSILELKTFLTLEPLINLLGREIEGIFRKEFPLRENLILEVSSLPIIGEEEKLGTLVILHDITREKMIEKMKTEFVSIAAHQLRTPLSAIKWTLKTLLDKDLGEITPEQEDFIEKCYKSNERMISLINDLLDVTRIEEGRYIFKQVSVRLEPIIQSVVSSYEEEIVKRAIKFEFKKPEEKLPILILDVEKIKLVIGNLIDNAIRYTRPGGRVTVSTRCIKNEIEVSVKDTGVGIPLDQQQRMFTKFFRASNVMRMETEGSGLGLFIAKNIIEAHHGRIWFESEENKGSTFHFTIPSQEELTEFVERL